MDKSLVSIDPKTGFLIYGIQLKCIENTDLVRQLSILRGEWGTAYPVESLEITAVSPSSRITLWDENKWDELAGKSYPLNERFAKRVVMGHAPLRPKWYLREIKQVSENYYVLDCIKYLLGRPTDGRELIPEVDFIQMDVGFNIDPAGGIVICKDWDRASAPYQIYTENGQPTTIL